jgi:hypothetical protein
MVNWLSVKKFIGGAQKVNIWFNYSRISEKEGDQIHTKDVFCLFYLYVCFYYILLILIKCAYIYSF